MCWIVIAQDRKSVRRCREEHPKEATMSDPKNLIIVLLVAAVAVLGYLYYDSQQTAVRIDTPGFKLEAR